MNTLRNRILFIAALTLLALYSVSPTIIYFSLDKNKRNDQEELNKVIPNWLPEKHIKLGLDLQGGVQLVLGVDTEVAVANKLGRVGTELMRWTKEENIKLKTAYVPKGQHILRLELEEDVDAADFMSQLKEKFYGLEMVDRNGQKIDFSYNEDQMKRIRDAALGQAERVVRNRIDKWGVSEPLISRRKDGSILVQLPGFKNPERARELLGRTAQLKFQMVDEEFDGFKALSNSLPENIQVERNGNYNALSFVSEDKQAILNLLNGKVPEGREIIFEEEHIAGGKKILYKSHLLFSATEISGEDVLDAFVVTDSSSLDNRPAVSLRFTGPGGKRFADITGENVNKRMAIILDGIVYSDPVINQRISGGSAQITLGSGKGYNEIVEEANELSLILKSGALPAPITILEERQVGATLGPELANEGVMSVLLGMGLVLIFMIIWYRKPGLISCAALFLNALFLLSLMAAFGFALTLPGFAGFVLTLGMAVDANVLINERIREELRAGKNAKKAVENGFKKVFWTIIDANVTTLIAALVLLETNSSGPIKGFSVALIIGLLASMFTALYCSRLMFDWAISGDKKDNQIRAWLGGKAAEKHKVFNFNFLKYGRLAASIGAVIAVAVLVVGGTKGINWAVDFAGGTELEVSFGKAVDADDIRDALKKGGVSTATLQSVGDAEHQRYLIRFEQEDKRPGAEAGNAKAKGVREVLLSELKDYSPDLQRVDFVGPLIGKELRTQGVMSLIWAIIGILVYIGLRFDMRFAPGAIVKMIQDVFIIMGFYIFFSRSFDLTSIAALLTVVGYSVNDTIVIYDRIRENMTINPRRTLFENINISINETLTRTINTSVTTIVALVGILVFTSAQIWNFAVAMSLGVVSATLTSTFIATTFLIWFEKYRKSKIANKVA